MTEIFGFAGVNPPHIYQIRNNSNKICVALGNGYLCTIECKDTLNGTHSWQAHNSRVMCCGYTLNEFIYSASAHDLAIWDPSFSLWKRISLENKVQSI